MLTIVLVFLGVVTLSFLLDSGNKKNNDKPEEATPEPTPEHPPLSIVQYQYAQRPIFSPDQRYIWDGEKWIENNNGLGWGIILGFITTLVLLFNLF